MRKAFDRLRGFPFNEQVYDAMMIVSIVTVMFCGVLLVYKTQAEHRRAAQPGVEVHSTGR